jgi:hypothetical protein
MSRTAIKRRWSVRRSLRRTSEVAADFMSVVSTRLLRPASPARVACSTRMGLLSITYGIAGLGRRCSHADGSGTDLSRRFHEHARGVGSRSLGSFTPSTSQGFWARPDNPPADRCQAAQVCFTACRSPLHVAKKRLPRCSGGRSHCVHASSRTQQIGHASWEGRAQRSSIPGPRLGYPPPTEARRSEDAPAEEQHPGDLSSSSRPTRR